MIALILGGARTVWDDVAAYEAAGGTWDIVIAVNEAARDWPRRLDHFVTLHAADSLAKWKAERAAKGGNMDFKTWSEHDPRVVDQITTGWHRGSSGFTAVGVAVDDLKIPRSVLCGIPMQIAQGHYFDTGIWKMDNIEVHLPSWRKAEDKMKGKVWSMSGWTRKLLGPPPWVNV